MLQAAPTLAAYTFMPHGHCYLWREDILLLHTASDIIISLAYIAIPLALAYFVVRRWNHPYRTLLLLFASFIFLCGCTHIMSVVTTWFPVYVFEGWVKFVTGAVSAVTAVVLWPLIPKAVAMPEELFATRRNLVEESLQKAKAQQQNELKSQFLANMSHEIRTPMTSIIGFTDFLLEQDMRADHKEMMRLMNESATHLRRIIDDALDLSKIESGKLGILRRNMDLKQCLRDVVALLEPRAHEKGIYLNADIDSAVPDTVSGDRVRIAQVVTNLVHNAIKFTSVGGVTVSLHLEAESEMKVCVSLTVEDSGSGIARENLERVFDAFTQESEGTPENVGGTGLGLTIASRLVAMMGGQMSVESEKGHGTSFFVTLWLDREQAAAEQRPQHAGALTAIDTAAEGKTPRANILVAEDNAAIQRLIERMLQEAGFNVDMVADGEEAVRACEQRSYDLLVLDVRMPNVDGYTAARRIREGEGATGGPRVPIIACTAHAFDRDRKLAEEAGMDAFISKPIDRRKLIETIRRLLSTSLSSGGKR